VPLALPLRVPLALPVLVTRRKQAIQHWQSQWHTERNGQLFFKFLVAFRSAKGNGDYRRLAATAYLKASHLILYANQNKSHLVLVRATHPVTVVERNPAAYHIDITPECHPISMPPPAEAS